MTEYEMQNLKETIKRKYEAYRVAKPGKYPALKFNSYPAPYEHLRNSFKEELTNHGEDDMQEAIAVIPSIKVFAKIFHEGYVLKDEKLLDTCYLYAWGKPRSVVLLEANQTTTAIPSLQTTEPRQKASVNRFVNNRLLVACGIIITVLLAYLLVTKPWVTPRAHGLSVYSPTNGDTVPRVMLAEGKVANASTVWIIIRPLGWLDYYVQTPIKVADDGTWRGPIHIGGTNKAHIGIHSQLRAFVNPTKPLLEDQLIHAWPDAELSSDIIEIVRGTQDVQVTTP